MLKPDMEQQNKLNAFYKEETTWFPNHVLLNFVAWLFIGISMIMISMPYLAFEEDDMIMQLYMYIIYNGGISLYASKYRIYTEYNRPGSKSIYSLLRYLPISRMQLLLFLLRKLFKPCLIITLIAIWLRNLFSISIYHAFSLYDVVIPVICNLLLPLVLQGISFLPFSRE